MWLGRLRLDIRKDFLSVRIITQWKRFLRGAKEPQLLEAFKKALGRRAEVQPIAPLGWLTSLLRL